MNLFRADALLPSYQDALPINEKSKMLVVYKPTDKPYEFTVSMFARTNTPLPRRRLDACSERAVHVTAILDPCSRRLALSV